VIATVCQRYASALVLLLGLALMPPRGLGEDVPSPVVLAKIQKLMAVSDAVESSDLVVENSTAQYGDWLEAANPGRRGAIDRFVKDVLIPRIKERLPNYYQQTARIYAKHLAPDDIDQLIAFYQSPLGRKLVAARKEAIPELTAARHAWWSQTQRDLLHELAPEFQKRGLTIPRGANG